MRSVFLSISLPLTQGDHPSLGRRLPPPVNPFFPAPWFGLPPLDLGPDLVTFYQMLNCTDCSPGWQACQEVVRLSPFPAHPVTPGAATLSLTPASKAGP